MDDDSRISSDLAASPSLVDETTDDEEMDWEEVQVEVKGPEDGLTNIHGMNIAVPTETVEVTFESTRPKKPDARRPGGKGLISAEERAKRLQLHKAQTVCLIANGWIRNRFINDELLHARLISLTPLPLQTAFNQIHKRHEQDIHRRGRLFITAMMRLTQWWQETYFHADERGSGEIQNRTYEEVAQLLQKKKSKKRRQAEDEEEEEEDDDDDDVEIIRSPKSLQKHALSRCGSRDVSAQLFTALCRGLGIPARLIVSIQSAPWRRSKPGSRISKGHSPDRRDVSPQIIYNDPKGKGKAKAIFPGTGQTLDGISGGDQSMAPKPKLTPSVKLRKSRPQGRKPGSGPKEPEEGYPPTIWTEVFSRPEGQWLPLDPIRNFVSNRKVFEPPSSDMHNKMVYVLAFEEDGYARDVTQRYASAFTNKAAKVRGGKGQQIWWDKVMMSLTRPFRLHRDDLEDAELQSKQIIEGMPTSIAGFKDHPLYVLERHLLQNEVLYPAVEIGRFRGEAVFSRENVVPGLKTADNWMRCGRTIQEGAQPMKSVKVRASTISRRRMIESFEEVDGESEAVQGLYAYDQTELYHPPPVIDGKVPKNDFGNIDLYVDTMLPQGAAYIPHKGAAKVAKQLGFDYAEAVTGFEFKNRRAFPIISGIVVAQENEDTVREAYRETVHIAEERERYKQRQRVLGRWKKLVNGLRIRKRLQDQYG